MSFYFVRADSGSKKLKYSNLSIIHHRKAAKDMPDNTKRWKM